MDEKIKKEVDIMEATVEYNEKVFLTEFEESLKEMKQKKSLKSNKDTQSSWRDLFCVDKE